ncbi:MAG TPA: DUF438 domain-containing protein [Halanaerobiales bacterium]|nr:DUF438 domain-containing protein [Halanaerobiales bacterium]
MTEKKNQLKDILERLNNEEDIEEVKKEARDLIEEISAKDLSEAEQDLIDEGLEETKLRHLCAAHLEVMADELEEMMGDLDESHPLAVLVREHDEILNTLDRLEIAVDKIDKLDEYDPDKEVFQELKEIGQLLLETEKHHEREEEALFPEVDALGITGPTRIMRMEHDDLWPYKEEINELAQTADKMDFAEFKSQLKELSEFLVLTLRDHIYKENNILYPTAKDVITYDKWEKIKNLSNEIGYCSFTTFKEEE